MMNLQILYFKLIIKKIIMYILDNIILAVDAQKLTPFLDLRRHSISQYLFHLRSPSANTEYCFLSRLTVPGIDKAQLQVQSRNKSCYYPWNSSLI